MHNSFNTAKTVFSAVEIIGWLAVLAGVGFGLKLSLEYAAIQGILIGLSIAALGVLLIAVTQIGRAQIATAENTGAIVDMMKDDRKPGRNASPTAKPTGTIKIYKNRIIARNDLGDIHVDGKVYSSVIAAERAIAAGQT